MRVSNFKPLTYSELRDDLEHGRQSCVERVEAHIQRIRSFEHLNAFLEVFEERARAQAAEVDLKIKNGQAGKLAGWIVGIKDNLCLEGAKCSAGSKILDGFESLFTATAVARLLDEDAIIIGRLNCDEFAMGSSNEHSAFGPVLNPLDETRVPGGSSGGSAAAVAAGLCDASLGSDTGGSIRQPAAFTGLVGLKPSYGRISRHGLIAYASSFDQIGCFTHTVEDASRMLEIMAGQDPFDAGSSAIEVHHHAGVMNDDASPKRIAVLKAALDHPGLEPSAKAHFEEVVTLLRAQGHEVVPVEFEHLDQLVPIYYLLTTSEASSNLARYDGVRYGYRSQGAENLEDLHRRSRTEGFGTEVKRRILLGTFVLSAGYYDAYYTKAQKARRMVSEWVDSVFSEFDFLMSPTTPHEAFELNRESDDPTVMYLEDIYTVLANIAGIPAISIPTGLGKRGLPLGTQFMSARFSEERLLLFTRQFHSQLRVHN